MVYNLFSKQVVDPFRRYIMRSTGHSFLNPRSKRSYAWGEQIHLSVSQVYHAIDRAFIFESPVKTIIRLGGANSFVRFAGISCDRPGIHF